MPIIKPKAILYTSPECAEPKAVAAVLKTDVVRQEYGYAVCYWFAVGDEVHSFDPRLDTREPHFRKDFPYDQRTSKGMEGTRLKAYGWAYELGKAFEEAMPIKIKGSVDNQRNLYLGTILSLIYQLTQTSQH